MLVKNASSGAAFVDASAYQSPWQKALGFYHFVAERLSFLPHERDKSIRFLFSLANFGKDLRRQASVQQAEVLNLHWINQGFLSLQNIRQLGSLGKPIFLTLHDMWTFTGGCHYADQCLGYRQSCGQCPFLRKPHPKDLSHRLWQAKAALYRDLHFEVITPSAWLRDMAQQSSLFAQAKIHVVPNTIDTQFFKPLAADEKMALKAKLGIDPQRKIVFFLAMNLADQRKGFAELKRALELMPQHSPNWAAETLLLVAGKAEPEVLEGLSCPVHYLGLLKKQEDIMQAYNLADVFVMPSLEENLPNTIMESLACGTAVVAFRTGGIPEMIEHRQTGYLAAFKDAQDLAQGIQEALVQGQAWGQAARQKAENSYAYGVVAPQLIRIYEQALGKA